VRFLGFALLAALLSGAVAPGSRGAEPRAAGEVFTDVPRVVDPARRHLFYLHGAWIERHGLERVHPRFGRYEYRAIVRALAERGFVVIAHPRRRPIDAAIYAAKVAKQARRLLDAGVPPSKITVIGHSKGGIIALIAATELQERKVNFVVMAGCGKRGSGFRSSFERVLEVSPTRLRGRFLSTYDENDGVAGSCQEAFERSAAVESQEVVLQTGLGHGLFWSPRAVWIDRVVEWAKPEP
jgi:pimeloyl-ACP methyl ester carboxylesterase